MILTVFAITGRPEFFFDGTTANTATKLFLTCAEQSTEVDAPGF